MLTWVNAQTACTFTDEKTSHMPSCGRIMPSEPIRCQAQFSSKQLLKNICIMMFQPFRKFIYVKHVWRKALSPHPNRKLRVFLVEVKENQANTEQHAKGFKPTLVLFCQRGRHCYVGLG